MASDPRGQKRKAVEAFDADWFQGVAKSFRTHLCRTQKESTAEKYIQVFNKLCTMHKKDPETMASAKYLESVRKMSLPCSYAATVRAFSTFWSKMEAKVATPCRSLRTVRVKVSKLARRGTSAPSKCLQHLEDASDKDRACFSDLDKAFGEYLHGEFASATAAQYSAAFRGLFDMHGKAPHAMASAAYVHALRKLAMGNKYLGVAKAFCKFKGVNIDSTASIEQVLPQGQKQMKALRHFQDASSQDRASFPDVAKSFDAYLLGEFPHVTAQQYSKTFRRMFMAHGKALHEIASAKYVQAVRDLKMPNSYAATARAFCRFKGVVGDGLPERREHANREAWRLLKSAQEQGRRVSDADVLAVLRILPFPENTTRLNVRPAGAKFVHSSTVGLIADRCGRKCVSQITMASDGIVRLLSEWLQGQLGNDPFPFTSINLNKNFASTLHRDRNNHGPSAIRTVGEFHSGHLCYWPLAPRDAELTSLKEADCVVTDPRHSVVFFDGNNPHSVTPYAGAERFSIVFFTLGGFEDANDKTRAQLKRLGIKWPSNISMASAQRLVSRR